MQSDTPTPRQKGERTMLKASTTTTTNDERTLNTISLYSVGDEGDYTLLAHGIGSSKSRYLWLVLYRPDTHIEALDEIRFSEVVSDTLNNLTVRGVHLYESTTDIDLYAPSTADLGIDYLAGLWACVDDVEIE